MRAQQYWLAPSQPNGADGGGGRDADIDLSILTRNAKRLLILRRNREKTVQLPPMLCSAIAYKQLTFLTPSPSWTRLATVYIALLSTRLHRRVQANTTRTQVGLLT